MKIQFNNFDIKDYEAFLKCKDLNHADYDSNSCITDEQSYKLVFGGIENKAIQINNNNLFDYQSHVVNKALAVKRYAAFLDCGLGKTLIQLNWCKAISDNKGKVLLLCPLQVIKEFYNDIEKFNIDVKITNLRENKNWTSGIGILNTESLTGSAFEKINLSDIHGVCLDESSILKNGDGATSKTLRKISKDIEYRLACSATPSPNEQAEYGSHAVFLGYFKSLNEFYSRFFRKDGNKWLLKDWAVNPFYRFLSRWSVYIQNPNKLGFENGGYLTEKYELIKMYSEAPQYMGNTLFTNSLDMKDRVKIYGKLRSDTTLKRFNDCVTKASEYKSIVWAYRNSEEKVFKNAIQGSVLITGATPIEQRIEFIEGFKLGQIKTLISKPKILGWGVNLQQAEAHVFSGYNDSFEQWYQAIRRSHRNGRKGRLKVFAPITEPETPIFNNIIRKEKTFENDAIELQKRFNNIL